MTSAQCLYCSKKHYFFFYRKSSQTRHIIICAVYTSYNISLYDIYWAAAADNDDVLTKRRNVAIDVKTGPHSCACRRTLSSGRDAESRRFLLRRFLLRLFLLCRNVRPSVCVYIWPARTPDDNFVRRRRRDYRI